MKKRIGYGACLAAAAFSASAAGADPGIDPGVNKGIGARLTQAITEGDVTFNTRLRYEHADIDGLKEGDSVAIRPRLGYRTGRLAGFDGFAEYEGVYAIGGTGSYNSGPPYLDATNGNTDYATIVEPVDSQINRAWLRYTAPGKTTLKTGRQRIIYDQARFIGNVGWRLNEQTFDAAELTTGALGEAVTLRYAYIWQQNFIAFNSNDMRTHLVNLEYRNNKAFGLSAFSYLIDYDDNVGAGDAPRFPGAPDQRTVGLRAAGKLADVGYEFQYANQGQYADAPDTVDADYYLAELSYSRYPVTPTVGWEVAGGDGNYGFQFPLATNHAYFGWADVFLVTPADGLRDAYGALSWAPKRFKFQAVYHDFDADEGGRDYGNEVDAAAAYRFTDELSVLAKFADYNSDGFAADTRRYWLQTTYVF